MVSKPLLTLKIRFYEIGDFLVKIQIETPGKLSRKARKLVEELRNEGI